MKYQIKDMYSKCCNYVRNFSKYCTSWCATTNVIFVDIPLTHASVVPPVTIPVCSDHQHQATTEGSSAEAAVVTQTFTEVQSSVTSTQPRNALYSSPLPVQQGMQTFRHWQAWRTLIPTPRCDTTNPHSDLPDFEQSTQERWVADVATQQDSMDNASP